MTTPTSVSVDRRIGQPKWGPWRTSDDIGFPGPAWWFRDGVATYPDGTLPIRRVGPKVLPDP